MRKLVLMMFLAALVLAALGGWRAGACEVANIEFQDDLRDLAATPRSSWTYNKFHSDDDFRDAVVRKAAEYGIQLDPNQVVVKHDPSDATALYLSAEYSETVNVANFSMTLHFTPSSAKKFF